MSASSQGRRGILALLGMTGGAALVSHPAQAIAPPPRDWRGVAAIGRAATVTVLADRGLPLADALQPQAGTARRQGRYGSGVVLTADGLVLTNSHVVGNPQQLSVLLADGSVRAARLLGADTLTDLAVLRVEGGNLTPVALDRETPPEPGEPVLAVGAPFGLAGTVTSGIISGHDRPYNGSDPVGYLQHDAAINPGSSGGPLLDERGRLLGINTAIPEEARVHVGVSLAIPADLALRVAAELAAHGQVRRGWLGLGVQELEPDLAEALGQRGGEGLLVSEVDAKSPARGVVTAGDVLLAGNGIAMTHVRDLARLVLALGPGETARLRLAREGTVREVAISAAAAPPTRWEEIARPEAVTERVADGVAFAHAPRPRGGRAQPGVLVQEVEADGAGREAGLRPGDLVLAVGTTSVASPTEADAALARASGVVALLVRRGEEPARYVALHRDRPVGQIRGNRGGAFGGPF